MRGSTVNATSASRQFMTSIATMMPASTRTSPKIVTMPEANMSLSASTSVVTRVISRPIGFRS